eukprot:1055189-Amphidinium_carterae.1
MRIHTEKCPAVSYEARRDTQVWRLWQVCQIDHQSTYLAVMVVEQEEDYHPESPVGTTRVACGGTLDATGCA